MSEVYEDNKQPFVQIKMIWFKACCVFCRQRYFWPLQYVLMQKVLLLYLLSHLYTFCRLHTEHSQCEHACTVTHFLTTLASLNQAPQAVPAWPDTWFVVHSRTHEHWENLENLATCSSCPCPGLPPSPSYPCLAQLTSQTFMWLIAHSQDGY